MPTTQNRIEEATLKFLQSYGPDWYEELANDFGWSSGKNESAVKRAASFGLEYVGHGCTRVVFKLKDTSLVVKLEKQSEHGSSAFEQANEKELEALEYYQDNYPSVAPFLLKPVHSFRYDGRTMLVYPELKHDREAGEIIHDDMYLDDRKRILTATKAFFMLDAVVFDQMIGANTFIVCDMPISIDYGIEVEDSEGWYDYDSDRSRFFNRNRSLVETVMESDDFRNFQKEMDRIYRNTRAEMYAEAA